jgi:hypothetical protein
MEFYLHFSYGLHLHCQLYSNNSLGLSQRRRLCCDTVQPGIEVTYGDSAPGRTSLMQGSSGQAGELRTHSDVWCTVRAYCVGRLCWELDTERSGSCNIAFIFSFKCDLILINAISDCRSFIQSKSAYCRSQWPRDLRRRSAAARLLGLWVRIQPRAWMSVCCECCVLSGRGICDGLIPRPEESYRVWCV